MSGAPPDTPAQYAAEHAWLAGALITGTAYGVLLSLSWLCIRALWYHLRRRDSRRRHLFFFLYVFVVFVLGTVSVCSNSIFTQYAFINNRAYPGGPSAYEEQMWSVTADEVGNVSYVLGNWLSDSMLVWRCVIIYRYFGTLSGYVVLVATGIMQLASYVLGTFFLIQISSPQSSPFLTGRSGAINWTVPYVCTSLSTNIIVTILIVVRLLLYRRTMIQLLGPGHATECTTIVAMLVESAAVYTIFTLLLFVPFLAQSPLSFTFVQVIGEAQLIAPLLIIYREAQGKGWISSASSVATTTAHGDRDIRIGQFSDIEFASDVSYTEMRTFKFTSKQDSSLSSSAGGVGCRSGGRGGRACADDEVDVPVEEVRRYRYRDHEDVALGGV